MRRIARRFNELKLNRKRALIPYITAGDPDLSMTVPLMHALVKGGADIIELGIPFSDPMADGPVIQQACERALEKGTSLRDVLTQVKVFRETNLHTPIVLMGYLNPIEVMGYDVFCQLAKEAGVDGVLVVDMPPEEAPLWKQELEKYKLDTIYLIAPNTTNQRIKSIVNQCSGYVYYVSLKGVTGSVAIDTDDVKSHLERIAQQTTLPIAVGFGIKTPETAALIASMAEAIIVGSVLVDCIAQNAQDRHKMLSKIESLLLSMRQAIDC